MEIFRIIQLGEQELQEKLYFVYCFVTHLPQNQFISSDAMSKLRQVRYQIYLVYFLLKHNENTIIKRMHFDQTIFCLLLLLVWSNWLIKSFNLDPFNCLFLTFFVIISYDYFLFNSFYFYSSFFIYPFYSFVLFSFSFYHSIPLTRNLIVFKQINWLYQCDVIMFAAIFL